MSNDDGFVDPVQLRVEAKAQRRSGRRLWRLIGRSTRLVWGSGRTVFLLVAFLQLVSAAVLAGQVLAVEAFLSAVMGLGPDGAVLPLVGPVVLLVALMTGATLLTSVLGYLRRYLSDAVTRRTSQEVLDVASRVSLTEFESPGFYDALQRVQMNASMRPVQITQALLGVVGSLAVTVAVGATLAAIEPWLLVLLLLGGLPLLATSRWESRREFRFSVDQTYPLRERQYLSFLLTGRDEAKEVRAFDLSEPLRSRYDILWGRYQRALAKHLRARGLLSLLGSSVSAVVIAGTFLLVVVLIANGRLDVAGAGAAVVAIRMLQGQVAGLIGSVQAIFEAGLFLDDVDRFLAMGPQADVAEEGDEAPEQFGVIEARGVHFSYPGSDVEALAGVDVTVKAGEVVALVGENGSGKTTLAMLLGGLYDPSQGEIRWDGVPATRLSRRSIRSRVAVIFQDFMEYAFSAAENIAPAEVGSEPEPHRVRAAAEAAGAHGFLDRLPQGYRTVLSRMFRGGRDLSGGQWQRVAIARAFYRDAPLIILDEPTAALDARAESELYSSLRGVLAGRTAVFVSHRFSSVRSADHIYVLDEGRIAEHGTHEQLMALGGLYAELFTLQADAYGLTTPSSSP